MGMRGSGKWLGVLALAAVATVVLVRKGRDKGDTRVIAAEPTASVEELREEMARLKTDLRKMGRLSGTAITAAANAQASVAKLENDDKRPAAPGNGVVGGNVPPVPQEVLLDGTEQRYQQEPLNPNWSAEAETIARRHLSHAATGGYSVRQLACRSSICKALVVYESKALYLQAQGEMMNHPATDWKGQLAFSDARERPDGRIEIDTYLFREGTNPLAEIAEEENARLASNH